MLRYKLRTLLIVLAVLPPAIAWGYWNAEQYHRHQEIKRLVLAMEDYSSVRIRQGPPPPLVWALDGE